ncbi:MAG: cytochrome P450 [Tepidiformaceae bacterium]
MTTMSHSLTIEEINLNDDTLFERGFGPEMFKILRREDPVSWTPATEEIVGHWNFVRYQDVLSVSRHPEVFGSEKGIIQFYPADETMMTAAAAGNGKMLITMDPPRHVKLRRLVNKGFTPRAVAAMEPHIREITNTLLDTIAKKGKTDFVIDIASQIPLAVICGMMGLEEKDWPLMFQLTNKVLGSSDPEYQTDLPEDQRGTQAAAELTGNMGTMQMFGFFAQLLQDRRVNRRDDLISILCESEIEGEALSDEDILWFCFLLILAGNETTRNAMSGGLLAFFENPAERERLRQHPEYIDSAVEEIVRYVSPVMHMARIALSDYEVGGQQIKKGERVVMWYPSVNRDESIFPDGDVFNITRSPNEHLAFGIGEHFCLGAGFARLELKILFEEMFRRFPDIQVDGEVERLRSSFIGGIKHLPVKFTPEA